MFLPWGKIGKKTIEMIWDKMEQAKIDRVTLPLSSKICVRCGSKERYMTPANNEHCICGCLVPQCYAPMKGCYIATAKGFVAKHDPPSPADLAERRVGIKFIRGDIDAYIKDTNNSMTNATKALREMEAKMDCQCKNCEKEK